MTKPLPLWHWFLIGASITITLLSAFYLGRMTKPVVEVCAMGRVK